MYTLWSSPLTGFSTNGLAMRVLPICTQSGSSVKPGGSVTPSGRPSRLTVMCVGTGMLFSCVAVSVGGTGGRIQIQIQIQCYPDHLLHTVSHTVPTKAKLPEWQISPDGICLALSRGRVILLSASSPPASPRACGKPSCDPAAVDPCFPLLSPPSSPPPPLPPPRPTPTMSVRYTFLRSSSSS